MPTQTIWVIQRISDGKFLKKNLPHVYINWEMFLDPNTRWQSREYQQLRIDMYFTDKLGQARIFSSEKMASRQYPTWKSNYPKSQKFDIDWVRDGYARIVPIECYIPEYIE